MTLRYGGVFEQGNIRYLLSSSSFADPIVEGDYNTWTKKWSWDVPNGVYGYPPSLAFYIEEINNIFYLWWNANSPRKHRFGTYSIADHSAIFESPIDVDYVYSTPIIQGAGDTSFYTGCQSGTFSILRSHQSYILLSSALDWKTIEVWRAGVKLWSRDLTIDTGEAYAQMQGAEISSTAKYILFLEYYTEKLWLYEGSYVEP